MNDILRAEGVVREFQMGAHKVQALKGVSLCIPRNKLTVLRGPSGSGKTTLMNLLGTLDRATKGSIYFEGNEISKYTDRQRDDLRRTQFGFVFQSVALVSMLTAYENVEFGLRLAEFSAKERKSRAEQCLNMVGLQKRMQHTPSQMSGGEQQRVAIARAMAHKPVLIFADEPTAELDTHMSLQIVRLFKSLIQEENLSIVMTTHDPSMMEVADKVIALRDGVIVDE